MKAEIVAANDEAISLAAKIIMNGGLVVYPTETVYGLGCNPFNRASVRKVLEVKGRGEKPLPLLVDSLERAGKLAYFSSTALKVAKNIWPGPLTLVLKRREDSPDHLGGSPTLIGLRMPDHPVALKLTELCGGCIVGTSANLSGRRASKTAVEAAKQIGDRVDLILDGGKVLLGRSSTVLDLSTRKPKILREGPVDIHQLYKIAGIKLTEANR